MPEQLSFEWYEPPSRSAPLDAVFFALLPDGSARREIIGIADRFVRNYRLTGRRIALDRLHVSLCGVQCRRDIVGKLLPLAEAAARRVQLGPFDANFDRAMSFKSKTGNYPLVLVSKTDEILALFRTLGGTLAKVLGTTERKTLTPHVTMLYDRELILEQEVQPVSWIARELVLIHSLRGLTKHEVLGRWPLEG
jgi:2'-5' RNA ligase